jgi:ATP-binding cassette subfamily C protein
MRGISVVNRQSNTLTNALSLLSKASKFRVLVISITQVLLGFLDLVGVLLIGATVSLVVRGLTATEVGDRVNRLFDYFNLQNTSYENKLTILLGGAFVLLLGKTILAFQLQKRILRLLANQSAEASVKLLSSFFSSNLSFIEQRNKQNTIYALTTGVSSLIRGYIGSLSGLVIDTMLLIILLVGLLYISPITTIVLSTFYVCVFIFLNKRTHRDVRELSKRGTEIGIEINQKVSELIGAYRELVVRSGLSDFAKSIGSLRYKSASIEADLQFKSILNKYVFEIAMLCSFVLLYLIQRVNADFIESAATTSVFVAATTRIVPAIVRIQQSLINLNSAASASTPTLQAIQELKQMRQGSMAESSGELLDFEDEGKKASDKLIEIRNVTFYYATRKSPTIRSASAMVLAGQKVGIVGRTGSGKSTLLDILLGILEPNLGDVRIKGMRPEDLFKLDPSYVSYVPQRSFFFHGSVKDNLLLGMKDYRFTNKDFLRVLSTTKLYGETSSRRLQPEELILENGTNLSGGQRQSLGIARALLSSPKILILDEATSAMDVTTEQEILRYLFSQEDLTLVLISHRIPSLRSCDKIFFINKKTIDAEGTFTTLIKKSKEFRHIVKQFKQND